VDTAANGRTRLEFAVVAHHRDTHVGLLLGCNQDELESACWFHRSDHIGPIRPILLLVNNNIIIIQHTTVGCVIRLIIKVSCLVPNLFSVFPFVLLRYVLFFNGHEPDSNKCMYYAARVLRTCVRGCIQSVRVVVVAGCERLP